METLKIHQLKGYLGTGLKFEVKFKPENGFDEKIVIDKLSTISEEENCITFQGASDFYLTDPIDNETEVKPILHPLSDLTKEITVNCETFVPAEVFFSVDESELEDFKLFKKIPEIWSDALKVKPRYLDNWQVELLYKWHFDVHGLIEKGIAIDINSLDTNHYL